MSQKKTEKSCKNSFSFEIHKFKIFALNRLGYYLYLRFLFTGEILIGCMMLFGISKLASDLTGFSNTLKMSPSTSMSDRWSVVEVALGVFKVLSQGTFSVGDDRSKSDGPLLKAFALEGSVVDCPRTMTDVYFSKTWLSSSLAASTSPEYKILVV